MIVRPALPGDVPRGYALSSITSLTCTLFDPAILVNFNWKTRSRIGPTRRNICLMVHFTYKRNSMTKTAIK
jgi:hypothetical protein